MTFPTGSRFERSQIPVSRLRKRSRFRFLFSPLQNPYSWTSHRSSPGRLFSLNTGSRPKTSFRSTAYCRKKIKINRRLLFLWKVNGQRPHIPVIFQDLWLAGLHWSAPHTVRTTPYGNMEGWLPPASQGSVSGELLTYWRERWKTKGTMCSGKSRFQGTLKRSIGVNNLSSSVTAADFQLTVFFFFVKGKLPLANKAKG